MISLWPHWQRPLFLILLPILLYLLWKLWHLQGFKGSWQKIIPPLFQPWLLKGTAIKESSQAKLLLTIASLLALLALLGPSWQHIEQPPLKINSPLVIVLDLTPKMLSTDIPPSRLQSTKRKILDIIKARKDAQTAIVAYSGSAHIVVPLSDDQSTIANLLDSITPNIMPKIGERADLGIKKAIQLLHNTQQTNKASHSQILLITTGLSEQEQTTINHLLADQTINFNILGVGTVQGAPIMGSAGNFIKDAQGNIILPKLDSSSLQRFAYAENGRYSTITLDNSDIHSLNLTNLTGGQRQITDTEKKSSKHWQDQGYWLLLPLLLLAAFAGRKGWLLCLPLLIIFQPQPAQAFEWQQLWLNKNQQGEKLLQTNQPAEAAKRFQDKQWQGYSAYQANDYKKAAQKFAKETNPEGIYNYANAVAKQGKYQEAITEWDKAIKAKPNFTQAIKNKKIVEDLLKKQQQQQNQQQGDNKQNQNQDSDQTQDGQSQSDQQQDQQNQQQAKDQQNAKQQQGSNPQSDKSQQSQNENNKQDTNNSQADGEKNQQADKDQQKQQAKQPTEQSNKEQQGQANSTMNADEINKQEQDETLKQWIRTIPDDPSELLRRKFYYEQRYNRGDD